MTINRWPSTATGRSRSVAYGGLIWTVANATDPSAGFETQVAQSLAMLEAHLTGAGSARTHLLSLQVILTEIENRESFDRQWREWIGPDPAHWPQRVCFQAELAPGLLVELVAVAAPASVAQSSC
jgi:enamine deaminase RidA (YjgF/YER057c/UK114 family)